MDEFIILFSLSHSNNLMDHQLERGQSSRKTCWIHGWKIFYQDLTRRDDFHPFLISNYTRCRRIKTEGRISFPSINKKKLQFRRENFLRWKSFRAMNSTLLLAIKRNLFFFHMNHVLAGVNIDYFRSSTFKQYDTIVGFCNMEYQFFYWVSLFNIVIKLHYNTIFR